MEDTEKTINAEIAKIAEGPIDSMRALRVLCELRVEFVVHRNFCQDRFLACGL